MTRKGSASPSGFTSIVILLTAGIIVMVAGIFLFGQGPNRIIPQFPLFSNSPTPTPDETANWKNLSLGKLSFKIPSSWWSSSYTNEKENSELLNINPTKLPEPGDAVPAFTLNFEKNKTANQKKQELIQSWGFTELKETPYKIENYSGIILEGLSQPGYLESRRMEIALFSFAGNVYYLFDPAVGENHQQYFAQILSTFKFTQ